VSLLSQDSDTLQTLYQFRDNALAENETGGMFVRLYYRHTPEVTGILMENPSLAVRAAGVLKDVMPGIRFLLGRRIGKNITMTPLRVARIESLFRDIGKEGGEELADDLAELASALVSYKGRRINSIWDSLE
jgi:hypothetical protein